MATLLAVPRAVSGTRLYQLGLTARRLWQDVAVGVLSWIALTPLVISVYIVLGHLMRRWGAPPVEHPLTELSRSGPQPIEWGLIFVNAVVAAPLYEELLFRGLLQPWFASRPRGGDMAIAASGVFAVVSQITPLRESVEQGSFGAILFALAPILFVLGMVPIYLLLRLRWPSPALAGIFGTALLFGVAHSKIWPSPVALFLLGAGLGIVAYRTQSLVPSVVVHALFNAVAFVQLLFPQLQNGKDATEAALRAPPASISTAVPGSE
jgi:membrane protease YdiL (CAAX protease family)